MASTVGVGSAPGLDKSRIESFVHHRMMHFGMTWDEVAEMAAEAYGTLELAVQAVEIAEAQAKEGFKKAFPDGFENAPKVGRKPKPGEDVTFSRLGPNLSIRVWGGDVPDMAPTFSFDFINGQGQYIRTPEDIEIRSMPTAVSGPLRIFSIKQSLDRIEGESSAPIDSAAYQPFVDLKGYKYDANWETYIIHEGTALRITQRDHEDRFLTIPTRAMNATNTLVLQSWQALPE